jgi:hypothetical protein
MFSQKCLVLKLPDINLQSFRQFTSILKSWFPAGNDCNLFSHVFSSMRVMEDKIVVTFGGESEGMRKWPCKGWGCTV